MNYELFFEELKKIGYPGGLVLHGVHDPADFPLCVKKMRETAAKAGI